MNENHDRNTGRQILKRQLTALKPSDRLCLIYDTFDEWAKAVVPYLLAGLEEGEQCLYLADTHTPREIRTAFMQAGHDPFPYEQSGQLTILPICDVVAREGRFGPVRMIGWVISTTETVFQQNYRILRFTGEMNWALYEDAGSSDMIAYEARLNRELSARFPCISLYQYERPRHDPDTIKGAILTYPLIIRDGYLYHNTFSVEPAQYLNRNAGNHEVQWMLHNLDRVRQTRETLENSEQRYRSLFDQAVVGIFLHDLAGRIIEVNEEACRQTGYSRSELLDLSVFDLHDDSTGTVNMSREDILAHWKQWPAGRRVTLEALHRRKDGTSLPVQVTTGVVHFDGKKLVLALVQDMTGEKASARALRDSNTLLKQVQDIAHVGSWILDLKSGLLTWSEEIYRIFGLKPHEFKATYEAFLDTVHPEDRTLVDRAYTLSLRERRKGYEIEHRIIRRETGEVRHVFEKCHHERDVSGNIIRSIGIVQDITDRINHQQALEHSHDMMRHVIEHNRSAVAVLNRDLRYLYVSRKYLNEYRISDPEVIGKHYDEAISDLPDTLRQAHCKALEGEVVNAEQDPYLREDGSMEWTRWECRPWYEADKTIGGIIVYIEMISDRVKAEAAILQHNRELESLLAISSALRSADTVEDMLPILLDQTLTTVDTTAGAIWLYHPSSDTLRLAAARGWPSELENPTLPPAQGIVGSVYLSGKPHVSRNVTTDPLAMNDPLPEESVASKGVYFPIKTGEVTVGVFVLYFPSSRTITSEELTLLHSLAEMAGTAVHRLGLFEETRNRVRQLQAITRIDRAITTSHDLSVTLEVFLDQAVNLLQIDGATVFVLDLRLHTLHCLAERGFRSPEAIRQATIVPGQGIVGKAVFTRKTVISSRSALDHCRECPEVMSAENFQSCIGVPLMVKGKAKGVFAACLHRVFQPDEDWLGLAETLAGQAAIAIDQAQLFENLQQSNLDLTLAYEETIEGWSRALDLRDHETEGHSRRVTELAVHLASQAGVLKPELNHIRHGALLHDIGKVGIPDAILLKPGRLNESEWTVMTRHPQLAYDLLSPIAYLRPALDIPYAHHEKYNGTGYPRGLRGEQIPLAARIFTVVDVYDALTSDRPYRKAWSRKKALDFIQTHRGTHFDPGIVELFLREISNFQQ